MKHIKQFIPGPVEVSESLLQAQTKPMFGHRSQEYSDLHKSVLEKFREFMKLDTHEVYLFASSATGVMEAAVRNCVEKKILHTVCGSFSKRWKTISEANEKETGSVEVDLGYAIKPEMLEQALEKDEYEAVTITHNETSIGVENPLEELIDVVNTQETNRPLVLVDAVSSFGGTIIYPEKLGIDVLIFGTQKCLGLPPGLAFAVVSPRALEKSAKMKNKGYYFDFHIMKKYNDKNQTPATPAISLLNALDTQLTNMTQEGMEARAERHAKMAEMAREWCRGHGFNLQPEKGYESKTMTAVLNTPNIDIQKFRSRLQEKGYAIANAYGELKGKGFRIGHMGDWTVNDVSELLDKMTETLDELIQKE